MSGKGSLLMNNEPARSKVLDECLRRIESGQATVEDCLRLHPDHGDELRQALQLATLVRGCLAPAGPAEEVRDRLEARILNRLRGSGETERVVRRRAARGQARVRRPAFAMAVFAVILAILGLTTSAAYASTEALPGDLLYPVKHGLEQVRLAFSTSPQGEAALRADFADERLAEAEALVAAGRLADLESALQGYESEITALVALAEEIPAGASAGPLEDLESRLSHNLEVLARVRAHVPASAQEAIGNAIERAGQGRAVIERVRGGGNPSELAPGQEGRPDDQSPGSPQGWRDRDGKPGGGSLAPIAPDSFALRTGM